MLSRCFSVEVGATILRGERERVLFGLGEARLGFRLRFADGWRVLIGLLSPEVVVP